MSEISAEHVSRALQLGALAKLKEGRSHLLTPEERAALAKISPEQFAPIPPDAPASSGFTLESALPVKPTRSGYRHPIVPGCPYEKTYNRKIRILKSWIAEGRAANDPCPLDEPRQMVEWWQRHKKQVVPADLAAAAERAAISDETARPSPDAPSVPSVLSVDLSAVQGLDLAAAIESQQRQLAALNAQLDHALKQPHPDDSQLTRLSNRWDKCVERLRKLEDSINEQRIKSGELIAIVALREELLPIIETISTKFVEVLTDRVGLPRDQALAYADDCFRELHESRFSPHARPAAPVAA